MIYLVTNNPNKFQENPVYTFGTIPRLISYINSQTELGVDTETWGFDPHTKPIISLQIGDFDTQFVIDADSVDIRQFKELLERKILILHNGKFDLKFLYKLGIYPNKIYDTFVCEKILNCGLNAIKASLDAVVTRYANVLLDKSVRADIHRDGLTPRVISYAADDVKYLALVKKAQIQKALEEDLLEVFKLENKFTPCLAYIEFCGFKLNKDKWTKKMEKDLSLLKECEERLNVYILSNKMDKYIEKQLDLFSEPTCTINWSSSQQVSSFFHYDIGIDCRVKGDVETIFKPTKSIRGKKQEPKLKLSVEASHIQKYAEEHEIVKLYLEYKKAEKVVTTYGETFLKQINPVTNRIHTNFQQIKDTGRISSGGKDKSTGEAYVNFQNIPADSETRGCFEAEEGNTLIICDYSGQEQIVLANYSLDENILKFYDEGLGDMHSFVASQMYPELKTLSLDEIKSKHKDKRQAAKSAGFAINYGGTGITIAENLNVSKEEGDKIYEAYFEAFPGLRQYFNKVMQQGLNDGYILISPITKRKAYIYYYDRYTALSAQVTRKFWTRYRELKEFDPMCTEFISMKKIVKDYFKMKGEIQRMSLNYPIQGSSAEVTKISCIFIYEWILKNNLFGIVKFNNTVHDENVLECPIEMSKKVAEIVGNYMEKSGKFYCKRVPLKAVPELSTYWKK